MAYWLRGYLKRRCPICGQYLEDGATSCSWCGWFSPGIDINTGKPI